MKNFSAWGSKPLVIRATALSRFESGIDIGQRQDGYGLKKSVHGFVDTLSVLTECNMLLLVMHLILNQTDGFSYSTFQSGSSVNP